MPIDKAVFVTALSGKPWDEKFPDPRTSQCTHWKIATIPVVKVAHDGNMASVRSPDGEANSSGSLHMPPVRAKMVMAPRRMADIKEVGIHLRKGGQETIGIFDGMLRTIHACSFEEIGKWFHFPRLPLK